MSQVMQDQQNESQLVRGQVASIIQKGPDRWQIAVQPEGSQYTKNLWTKDQPLVGDMSQRIGQAFDFLCGVSHWTNQQNQAVRSLWINSVGGYGTLPDPAPVAAAPSYAAQPTQASWPAAPAPAVAPPGYPGQPPQAPAPAGQMGGVAPPTPVAAPPARLPEEVRETRIMRQTAMKCACLMIPYLAEGERNLHGVEQVAEWFVRYFVGGPQQQAGGPPQQAQAPQNSNPPVDPGPEPGDPGPNYEGGFPA